MLILNKINCLKVKWNLFLTYGFSVLVFANITKFYIGDYMKVVIKPVNYEHKGRQIF